MNRIRRGILVGAALCCAYGIMAQSPASAATGKGAISLTHDLHIQASAASGVVISNANPTAGGAALTFPGGGNFANDVILYNRPNGADTIICQTGHYCPSTSMPACPSGCFRDYGISSGPPYFGDSDVLNASDATPANHILHGILDNQLGAVSVTLTIPNVVNQINVYMPVIGTGPDNVTLTDAVGSATVVAPGNAGGDIVGFTTGVNTALAPGVPQTVTLSVGTANHDFADVFITQSASPTAAAYSRLHIVTAHGLHRLTWHATYHVLGFNVYAGATKLNHRLVTSNSTVFTFSTHHALNALRIVPQTAGSSAHR